MERWLGSALDYIPRWIEFQMGRSQQPGCMIAIAHRGEVVFERAFGTRQPHDRRRPDAAPPLPRRLAFEELHRGRHHAAARAGQAQARRQRRTVCCRASSGGRAGDDRAAALAHRGTDPRRQRRRPVPRPAAVLQCARAGRRPEAAAGHRSRLALQIFQPRLRADRPDHRGDHGRAVSRLYPARDHRRRGPRPRPRPTCRRGAARRSRAATAGACCSAAASSSRATSDPRHRTGGGFVSTAADLARFFAQLSPPAQRSVLSAASRREMSRRHWRNPDTALEQYYGLGIDQRTLDGWDWFGHRAGLQGYISRTCCLSGPGPAVSRADQRDRRLGASVWVDGMVHILQPFASNGAPTRR